jgi:hypothetical protein
MNISPVKPPERSRCRSNIAPFEVFWAQSTAKRWQNLCLDS